jgi:hypothetical protein
MKKTLITAICLFALSLTSAEAKIFEGNVTEVGQGKINRIVDVDTHAPISNATVSMPQKNYVTKTDGNGAFELQADISGDTILSVNKDGYKPFSLTINDQIASKPITVGIEKSSPKDIVIDSNMFHLGDNNYSDLSANSGEFRVNAIGPSYTKQFKMTSASDNVFLVIGSIIGIDTKMARSMGQNKILTAYAGPPEVFFNGTKVAEIHLNGDNQKIKLPRNLIRPNQHNEITLRTNRNMMQTAFIDYDDIEFMNLSIESN